MRHHTTTIELVARPRLASEILVVTSDAAPVRTLTGSAFARRHAHAPRGVACYTRGRRRIHRGGNPALARVEVGVCDSPMFAGPRADEHRPGRRPMPATQQRDSAWYGGEVAGSAAGSTSHPSSGGDQWGGAPAAHSAAAAPAHIADVRAATPGTMIDSPARERADNRFGALCTCRAQTSCTCAAALTSSMVASR